ncbi:hypothetical protein F5Y01DRAFT_146454 [Xylaria sp. FL0043]|nr:hypothetical protein F5Y01DRAFT_146454 [Xylaria sp. FL0043]
MMGTFAFPTGIAQRLMVVARVVLLATPDCAITKDWRPLLNSVPATARLLGSPVAYLRSTTLLRCPSDRVIGQHVLKSRPAGSRWSAARSASSALCHWLAPKPDARRAHRPAVLTGPSRLEMPPRWIGGPGPLGAGWYLVAMQAVMRRARCWPLVAGWAARPFLMAASALYRPASFLH